MALPVVDTNVTCVNHKPTKWHDYSTWDVDAAFVLSSLSHVLISCCVPCLFVLPFSDFLSLFLAYVALVSISSLISPPSSPPSLHPSISPFGCDNITPVETLIWPSCICAIWYKYRVFWPPSAQQWVDIIPNFHHALPLSCAHRFILLLELFIQRVGAVIATKIAYTIERAQACRAECRVGWIARLIQLLFPLHIYICSIL